MFLYIKFTRKTRFIYKAWNWDIIAFWCVHFCGSNESQFICQETVIQKNRLRIQLRCIFATFSRFNSCNPAVSEAYQFQSMLLCMLFFSLRRGFRKLLSNLTGVYLQFSQFNSLNPGSILKLHDYIIACWCMHFSGSNASAQSLQETVVQIKLSRTYFKLVL